MPRKAIFLMLPALASCAQQQAGLPPIAAAAPAVQAARPQPAAGSFAPEADHHLHLFSPADVDLVTPPVLPEVSLPADIALLVRERERRWNDVASLTELYTADSLFFGGGNIGWVQGPAAAARYAEWNISTMPYRVKPTRLSVRGASAIVAGYYTRPLEDGSQRHFGFFLYDLRRDAGGAWRIAAETYTYQPVRFEPVLTARELVARLDAAGIRRAAVMSNAYYFDAVRLDPVADQYAKVRAENDWTALQVSQFPDRLAGFCSFNPLKDYALAELDRCVATGRFTGLKLHFNAAQLNYHDEAQVGRVRRVMDAANRHRLPIIIHARPGNQWGQAEAEIFLRRIVSAAPDVPVQVAHLWGGESYAPEVLAVFADAVSSGDPATRNLYFEVSSFREYPGNLPEIAARLRQIGLDRLLYASDAPPAEAWAGFRQNMPLSEAELRRIADNVAPYLRRESGAR